MRLANAHAAIGTKHSKERAFKISQLISKFNDSLFRMARTKRLTVHHLREANKALNEFWSITLGGLE